MLLLLPLVLASLAALPLQQGPRKGLSPTIPADTDPVVTTPTGLKYCVLEKGKDGASPKFGDKVKVQYTGWNVDGSIFDSSRNGSKPAETNIGDVIDGWNEALMMMRPGDHWKLIVPPALGYGDRGSPPVIKPNATLIFELELLSFEKGPDLPPFHAGDPAKQKHTESGLVCEEIAPGAGPAPATDDLLEIKYAIWNTKGRMLDCSEKRQNFLAKGRAADMPYRVLQVAPQYMKVGSRWRFEVPADLCKGFQAFGAPYLPTGSTTIWELELISAKPIQLPPFVKPDPAAQKATASGLKYEVVKEGTGETPKPGATVTVRYSGWLGDGTLFDSSLLHGDTMAFPVQGGRGGVIQGWVEGLLLMKEGAIYRFEVPPSLAYGPNGRAPKIPGDATLYFLIELVKLGR